MSGDLGGVGGGETMGNILYEKVSIKKKFENEDLNQVSKWLIFS